MISGGFFDYAGKKSALEKVNLELENPDIWNNQERAQELSKQKKQLEAVVGNLDTLDTTITGCKELFDLATSENDEETILLIQADLNTAKDELDKLEFRRMFSHPMDPNNCFIDIQAGSGGT